MSTSESENIEQEVDGAFRSAVTQAAALGRMVAQMREQTLHSAARREEAVAAEIQRRYEAERQYARVILSQADHDGWWNTASTERVASVVATAQAWQDKDPEIARLSSRLDDRAQARWGIRPTARIDALTPAQRRQEAQQLMAVLSLDQLDNDDPLLTFVAAVQEVNQAEHRVDERKQPTVQEARTWHAEHFPEAHDAWEREYNHIDTSDGLRQAERRLVNKMMSHHDSTEEQASLRKADQYHAAPESQQVQQEPIMQADKELSKDTREQQVNEFEQLMRSNGMDQETIAARLLPERANAKPPQEAANVKPSTAGKPKNRGGLSQGNQRDAERGR